MQVVVTRELGKRYRWITKLTDRVEWADMEDMAEEIRRLPDEHERMNAESVIDFIVQLNYEKEWVKEAYAGRIPFASLRMRRCRVKRLCIPLRMHGLLTRHFGKEQSGETDVDDGSRIAKDRHNDRGIAAV